MNIYIYIYIYIYKYIFSQQICKVYNFNGNIKFMWLYKCICCCKGDNNYYYKDEIYDDANESCNDNRINNQQAVTSISFEYKIKLLGRLPNNNNVLDTERIFMV